MELSPLHLTSLRSHRDNVSPSRLGLCLLILGHPAGCLVRGACALLVKAPPVEGEVGQCGDGQ